VEDVQPLWLVPQLENSVLKPILSLIQQYEDGHVIRDGYHICIVGRPNVGKSSLMNWLVKKDRSIVTDIPGTTRDIVEESVVFRGIPVNFSDTAGVHITQDRVESLGIEKTFERIQGSDLVLLLMDASIAGADLEKQLLDQTGSIPVILVVNKIDLAADQDNIVVDERFSSLPMVAVSVKNRIHLDALVDVMVQKILHKIQTHAPAAFIPNLRQVRAFEAAAAHVRQAMKGIEQGSPLDIIAIDIRDTVNKIDEITGTQTTDAMLDDIFSAFCIGK
jgi:tRNA modification GTPase